MALRAILRRNNANFRNQVGLSGLQTVTSAFAFTKLQPLSRVLKTFSIAELDVVKEVRSDLFSSRFSWSGMKCLRGAIVGSPGVYGEPSLHHGVSVSHSEHVSSQKNEVDLHHQRLLLSGSSLITSSGCSSQSGSNFAAQRYFDRCQFSTASEESVSRPANDIDQDEQDKRAPVVENLEASRASERTWIERALPRSLRPFAHLARLDRPIGTWLLAWPCFWSICLAAPAGSFPDLKMITLFGVGAVLLRGAGCTVNDLLDSDIDGKVARTRVRPLASGALTTFQGIGFLGCQLLLGLGILLQLNDFSQILGASSLLLVGTYPLMKRWTYWPQAFLGLTFNWGALLGWAAVHGDLDLSVVLPLYASGVSWTIVYDTIYAHQDKDDDLKVGVMSTALRFGEETKAWLAGFSFACISSLTLAGINADLGWAFYPGLVASAGHLAWQVFTVDINDRADCNSKFVSNKWFGAIVCSAIVAGKLVS